MISHEHKFIFIHICRCAGTSIETFFKQDFDYLNSSGERHALPARYRSLWQDYFTFTNVRNPWDRVWSAANYTVQRNLRDTPVKRRLHEQCGGDFKTFIREVLTDDGLMASSDDALFWPQSRWLVENGQPIEFDAILRFESLEQDTNRIASRIGLSQFSIPHTNSSEHGDFRDFYDDETIEIVGKYYAEDIELLGYRFDGRVGEP